VDDRHFKELGYENFLRRDVLRTVAATAGAPMLTAQAAPLPRIDIVGAGMAGVSLA
jgi:hypothetical protein